MSSEEKYARIEWERRFLVSKADQAARAFATAAGYVADAICTAFRGPDSAPSSTNSKR